MKQLAGMYRASASNSYTNREEWGDLTLVQDGSKLSGSYVHDVNFEDCSPIAFSLPENGCGVTGEVCEEGCSQVFADDVAYINFRYEHPNELRHDAVLRLGLVNLYAIQLGNGALLCNDRPNMTGSQMGIFQISGLQFGVEGV